MEHEPCDTFFLTISQSYPSNEKCLLSITWMTESHTKKNNGPHK